MGKFQIIASILGAVVVVSLVSLIWPKFTTQPRPLPLGQVRDLVLATKTGQSIAQVLGVTNESTIEPINISSVASSVTESVISGVQHRAQSIVVHQAVKELTKQFDQLPQEQQQEIQQLICKP